MKNKAFTLIELLVVVLIIGILAAVALPQYRKAVFRSRMSSLDITMRAYQTGIANYILENGGYPTTDVYFTGNTNKRTYAVIDVAGVDFSNDFTCTKDGYWKVFCGAGGCYINFWSNYHEQNGNCVAGTSWFGGINTYKTQTSNQWILSSIQDNIYTKDICLWWAGKYGSDAMTNSIKTTCGY